MNDRILSAEQAYEKIKEKTLIMLDIRRPHEWQQTGIAEGAIPLSMEDSDFLNKLEEIIGLDKPKPIAIICAAGGRSARVAQSLYGSGYDDVFDVSEGMSGGPNGLGWIYKKLPLSPYVAESHTETKI